MTETWSWIDADGVAWSLDNFAQGVAVVEGVAGRGMPPVRRTRDIVAGVSGTRLRDAKHDMRQLTVPILVHGADEAGRAILLRTWLKNFDPTRGPGIFEVSNAVGNLRRLTCTYAQGFEITEDANERFPGNQLAVPIFEADDPYWYAVAESSVRFSATTTPATWFPGGIMLPITLGTSGVFGAATITVPADVLVWPRWTITGPGTNLIIRSETLDREFIWNASLTAGQQLIVDTRPGVKTVLRENGSNQFVHLTAWDLFALMPGLNNLTVSMTGTTSASSIVAAWTNRFLTP